MKIRENLNQTKKTFQLRTGFLERKELCIQIIKLRENPKLFFRYSLQMFIIFVNFFLKVFRITVNTDP